MLLAGALIQQGLKLTIPITIGRIIDTLATNNPAIIEGAAAQLTTFLAMAFASVFIVNLFSRHLMIRMVHRVRGGLICDAFDHLLTLPVGFHETRNTGNKTKIIQNGSEKTVALAQSWAERGIPFILYYALSTSILLSIWWPAGLVIGIGVPLAVTVSVIFYQRGKALREERHNCYEASESLLVESIQHIATVQSFRVEKSHSKQIRDIWETVYRTGFKEMRSADYGYIARNGVITLSIVAVMYLGLHKVAQGSLTPGMFILVLSIVIKTLEELWPLGQIIDDTIHNAPSLHRLREIFAIESDVREKPAALSLQECEGSLVFNNVTFRYPGKTENALEDFSLSIKPGSTVALVGPSGAGKSTVFKLARRFADPQKGTIVLDGHNLRDLSLGFRQHIAIVSQEIDIFSGTIAENIAFGRKDISQEEIERIARIAHVDEFVQKLPEKYNTPVGERGLKLSGGQRQRLAIARALAADCPIIFFDEATSHLDPESEALIQQALKNLIGCRTILIIAHRLSTIRNADSIVVMDGGRVVQQGTHDSLKCEDKGLYQKHLGIQSN